MVHATDAAIANAAVVTAGGLESLALPAHGMRVTEHALAFAGNGLYWNGAGVCKGCFGVRSERHHAKCIVYHAENNRDAFRYCECCYGKGRIKHEYPNHC